VQTFLPYPNFARSAAVLDRARLGKQRVECLQLIKTLTLRSDKGWSNHPCARMWRPNVSLLLAYGLVVCRQWTDFGYRDTCAEKMIRQVDDHLCDPERAIWCAEKTTKARDWGEVIITCDIKVPSWMGKYSLHRSHMSNLVRKDADIYRPKFPSVSDTLEYFWPRGEDDPKRVGTGFA
jgi:hypothetical protein